MQTHSNKLNLFQSLYLEGLVMWVLTWYVWLNYLQLKVINMRVLPSMHNLIPCSHTTFYTGYELV